MSAERNQWKILNFKTDEKWKLPIEVSWEEHLIAQEQSKILICIEIELNDRSDSRKQVRSSSVCVCTDTQISSRHRFHQKWTLEEWEISNK